MPWGHLGQWPPVYLHISVVKILFQRLQVEHFKSIPTADVLLPRVAVIVGPNSSGKSNFLDSLSYLKDILNESIDEAISKRVGPGSVRQWSPSRPYNIRLAIEIASESGRFNGNYSVVLAVEKNASKVVSEEGVLNIPYYLLRGAKDRPAQDTQKNAQISFKRNRQGKVQLEPRHFFSEPTFSIESEASSELLLSSGRSAVSVDPLTSFRPLLAAITDQEKYTIFPNTLRTPQKPSREKRLLPGGENFPSVFRHIMRQKDDTKKNEIIESLKCFMPKLHNIRISDTAGLLWPVFVMQERNGKTHDFNASQVSDGTLRLLGNLTALYQPSPPATIAIEEPEQTLHPGALSLIAEAIRDVSSKNQVLVTTHSPEFLNLFKPEEVIAVNQDEEGLTEVGAIRKEQLETIEEGLLTLGESMRIEEF